MNKMKTTLKLMSVLMLFILVVSIVIIIASKSKGNDSDFFINDTTATYIDNCNHFKIKIPNSYNWNYEFPTLTLNEIPVDTLRLKDKNNDTIIKNSITINYWVSHSTVSSNFKEFEGILLEEIHFKSNSVGLIKEKISEEYVEIYFVIRDKNGLEKQIEIIGKFNKDDYSTLKTDFLKIVNSFELI